MRPSREHDLNSVINLPVYGESGSYSVGMSASGAASASHHILCLPGILETQTGFDSFLEFGKNSHATYSLDFSGRGLSDYLPAGSEYRMSHCLKEAFSAFNYMLGTIRQIENDNKHIHLIGNSMGGLIAIFLALTKPSYLRSIVVNDVGCVLPWAGLMALYGALGRSSFLPNRHRYGQDAHSLSQRLNVDPRLLSAVLRPDYMDLPHQKTFFGISFEEQFSMLDIPIMVVRSSESQLLTQAVLERMYLLSNNLYITEVPGTAHPVPYSKSLVSSIYEFILNPEKKSIKKEYLSSSLLSFTRRLSDERAIR